MAGQGCPGEGADRRTLGFLICPLQRLLSWKSQREPALWWWKSATTIGAVVLWPPYLVVNRPHTITFDGQRGRWRVSLWRLCRIGWRYDKNWKGYIGPGAAFKKVPDPLLFY